MSENKNFPTTKVVKRFSISDEKKALEILLKEALEENDQRKKGQKLEEFTKALFRLGGEKIRRFQCQYRDKQIDFEALNNGLFLVDKGTQIYGECKNTGKIGAPPCYKIAGQMWLSGGRIKTSFLISLGGFYKTAYEIANAVRYQNELYTLVLINETDVRFFLATEESFVDWIEKLYLKFSTGASGKIEVERPKIYSETGEEL